MLKAGHRHGGPLIAHSQDEGWHQKKKIDRTIHLARAVHLSRIERKGPETRFAVVALQPKVERTCGYRGIAYSHIELIFEVRHCRLEEVDYRESVSLRQTKVTIQNKWPRCPNMLMSTTINGRTVIAGVR